MIHVTRLGGQAICLNADLIEEIDSLPDTTLLMTTGRRVIVQESADEVVRRVVAFRRELGGCPLVRTGPAPSGGAAAVASGVAPQGRGAPGSVAGASNAHSPRPATGQDF